MSDTTEQSAGKGAAAAAAAGSGVAGARHHAAAAAKAVRAVPSVPALRRLARRGGVKRLTASTNPVIRAAMIAFLERVIGDAVVLTEYRHAKTITFHDVTYALRRAGTPLYGSAFVERVTHSRPQPMAATRAAPADTESTNNSDGGERSV